MLSILSKLNRPLPAWITILLFAAGAASAAPMIWKGSVAVPSSGTMTTPTITVQNGSAAAQANITETSSSYPALAYLTAAGVSSDSSIIKLDTSQTTHTNPVDATGQIWFMDSGFLTGGHGNKAASFYCGVAGLTAANDDGGFCVSTTKTIGGGVAEVFAEDPQQHWTWENKDMAFSVTVTTPASCSAGIACGQATYNFTKPFYATDGTVQNTPTCVGLTVQDTTTATDAWGADINTVSYSAITINYIALSATSAAKTLTITGSCYNSNY